jgi:2,4-dienoyl-CoA reductase-like NADH-dependent reductase (Old Yellow Enzyme family)
MSLLFEPARIGPLEVKNRFVHSATYECMAGTDGEVTDELVNRYRTLARGEVGLIIPGYLYVLPRGKAIGRQTGIHHDGLVPGLKKIVDVVHEEGGCIAFQLAHGGRQSPKKVTGQPPLAPSSFGRDPISMNRAKTASEADIQEVIRAFAQAARRALEAGADALQLHCAHGFLLSEFLSPFFNRRQDQWGGTPENMFRIVKEIILAIRAESGGKFPILVKLNTADFTPKPGITPELAARYAGWLKELEIAALEISSGTFYTFHTVRGGIPINDLARGLPRWMRPMAKMVFKKLIDPCRFQPLYHLPAARIIKPVLGDVPLMLVGAVRNLNEMEEVVRNGEADFVSMSRPLIREPFLVKRLREGKAEAAACISCNKCFAAIFNNIPLRCYVDGLPQ